VIEITDHGGGIPEAEQSRVFQRFYRSPSVNQHIQGSGLGLSIADRIVRAHSGTLGVSSRPGETTFQMTVPFQKAGDGA
jgi:two-component system, OmpR family, sensor kinase